MESADQDYGHHAQASLSYILYYTLILAMVVTGFILASIIHGEGPFAAAFLDSFKYLHLLRQIHEYSWWVIAFFVVTHIGALIFHEWHDRIPIAQSMISGYQYRTDRKDDDDVKK